MLDLPAFCCYYKVVIDFMYILLALHCCEPGQGCQKVFAVLNLHKETQNYSSSAGNRSVPLHKHLWEGNAVCKDTFGSDSHTRRGYLGRLLQT